jgi:hypothetical protein
MIFGHEKTAQLSFFLVKTAQLSINRTSPFCQGMARLSSSRIFKQSWMISPDNGFPSPKMRLLLHYRFAHFSTLCTLLDNFCHI